jgi:hypothetical protein
MNRNSWLVIAAVSLLGIGVATAIRFVHQANTELEARAKAAVEAKRPVPPAAADPAARLPALPVSKAVLLSELDGRFYKFEAATPRGSPKGVSTYRVRDASAMLDVQELAGKLCMVHVNLPKIGTREEGKVGYLFAESVAEIVLTYSRADAQQAIARAVTDLGTEATDPRRFVGFKTPNVTVRATRDVNGNIGITFVPNPVRGI